MIKKNFKNVTITDFNDTKDVTEKNAESHGNKQIYHFNNKNNKNHKNFKSNKNNKTINRDNQDIIQKKDFEPRKKESKDDKSITRGDLVYADLSPVIGSEQGGVRPVLVIQNDVGNKFSPTTIVAAITSVKNKSNLPTHVKVGDKNCGLPKESVVLMEQIRTIDKKRLKDKIGRLPDELLKKIDDALRISISLEEKWEKRF